MWSERSGSVPRNSRIQLRMQRVVASKRKGQITDENSLGRAERREEEEVSRGMGKGTGCETEKWGFTDHQTPPASQRDSPQDAESVKLRSLFLSSFPAAYSGLSGHLAQDPAPRTGPGSELAGSDKGT